MAATAARTTTAAERLCPRCHGVGWIRDLDGAALVAAIWAEIAEADFNTTDLVTYAAAAGGPLAAALGNLKGRRLGKALCKIAGQEFSGLVLECIGADRDGQIWRVCEFG